MDRSKKQIAWWYYFWFLIALSAILPFFGPFALADWALWGFETIGLVGLWAYIRRRPVASRHLWRIYFIAAALSVLYSNAMFIIRLPDPLVDGNWQKLFIALLALASAVFLPLFIALWRYAFRSSEIWQGNASAA